MKTFAILFAGLVSTWAQVRAADENEKPKLPNVVYIMADDLGIGDVKCYGEDRCAVETPGFDRLAAEGVKFTDAHVVASVCVPSRLAIMTGRYPWRFVPPRPDGAWGFLVPRMKVEQFTLGDMMQEAGYLTGYVGKWHLGTAMARLDENKIQGIGNVDFTKPLEIGPGDYGFKVSMILPASLDMYPYAFVRDHKFVGSVTATKGWSAFNRQGPAAEDFEDTEVLDTIAGSAEEFIAAAASDDSDQRSRPFFLCVGLTAPHTPTSPSSKFRGKSELGLYGDFLMETDDCVVRVLDALDRHGLADNTLVIATSDHGPAPYAGNIAEATFGQLETLEEKGHDSNLDYRGYKFSLYEGGLRVPFVARWPGVAQPGQECRELIGLHDLMATLADVTGYQLGEEDAVDSVSWLPLLKNHRGEAVRESMIMASTHAYTFRQGAWKLILDPGSGCPGKFGNSPTSEEAWDSAMEIFGEDRKPTAEELRKPPFIQLYHLRKDPGEWNDYAPNFPPRVEKMLKEFDRQVASGRSTPGKAMPNDREVRTAHGRPKPRK